MKATQILYDLGQSLWLDTIPEVGSVASLFISRWDAAVMGVEPMELGHLPYKKRIFEDYVGACGYDRLGKKNGGTTWRTCSPHCRSGTRVCGFGRRKRQEIARAPSRLPSG
jgi:hypothetical protein